MKKLFLGVAVIAVLAILLSRFGGENFERKLEGESAHVVYSYVHVREKASDHSTIKGSLYRGDRVCLTGHTHSYLGDSEDTAEWVQITLPGGEEGWIVRDSVAIF